jgi:hypothetical protein
VIETRHWQRTVKVDLGTTLEDDELTAAEEEASAAGSLTSSAASAETKAAPMAAANSRGRIAAMKKQFKGGQRRAARQSRRIEKRTGSGSPGKVAGWDGMERGMGRGDEGWRRTV